MQINARWHLRTRAVLNQQVAIEEIGAACPQPASRICKPNSP